MFWPLVLIGWLSLHCLVLFVELDLFFYLGHIYIFFVLAHLLHSKGQSLCYSSGLGNPGRWVVALYMGRDQRGNNATCWALGRLSVTSPATHKQIGPFWCWFRGGWICVHSRTLWVSPTNSPVRLGVSPTSTTQVFLVRGFEALFPLAGTLGWAVCLAPQLSLPVYQHTNVGQPGLPAATTSPAPVLQPQPCCESSLPGCPPLPLLPAWRNVLLLSLGGRTSIQFNFLAVLVTFCF